MRVLLLAGLGPYNMNTNALDGTLLTPRVSQDLRDDYRRLAGREIDVTKLYHRGDSPRRVLRKFSGTTPQLSMETLRSILETTDVDFELFDLEDLWLGTREPAGGHFDVVGLSTTYICDQFNVRRVVEWISERYPGAKIVLGGQYSNLKYAEILNRFPIVDYIIRGDAELAFPMLLRAIDGTFELCDVPNLVFRDDTGAMRLHRLEYIDLNEYPSPTFNGQYDVVPYESMRGCPFTCKYCSFPAASPKWRFKSVEKICSDWSAYAQNNSAQVIRSMDSTFTIPPTRLRSLLDTLPGMGIRWEAYTRANTIDRRELVEQLEAAHCVSLRIGFESMSDSTLRYMDKKVSATQNERAADYLNGSQIDLHASFIVGYPGETPEEYEKTHRFLLDRYRGRFGVHVFMLVDETMPVWNDAELHQIEVMKDSYAWKHVGMDSEMALKLRDETMFKARWENENSVMTQWQVDFERPVLPDLDPPANYRIEKLIERLGFVRKDWGVGDVAADRCRSILSDLKRLGVEHERDDSAVSPSSARSIENRCEPTIRLQTRNT